MRFASALQGDRRLLVRVDGDLATPLQGPVELGRDTPLSWLATAAAADDPIPLSDLRLRPVVPNPAKVVCVGLNYVAHIEETHRLQSDYPVLFTKFASTLAGPYDELALPPESEAIDFEGELTIVIGAPVRRASRQNALEAVAGFTVANDLSMRDYQYKTHQWLQGKAWDATTPVGPALVTLDEAGDGSRLTLRTTLNGEVVQESCTDLMIFDVATLIATITEFTSLEPGDLILTGTPSGVGYRREPKVLLSDGDLLVTEIEGIGRLQNRCVAEGI
jgi:acylpyruvate hydrolase